MPLPRLTAVQRINLPGNVTFHVYRPVVFSLLLYVGVSAFTHVGGYPISPQNFVTGAVGNVFLGSAFCYFMDSLEH